MNTYEFQPVSEPDSHLLRLRPSSSGGQGVTGAEADRFADVKAADDSLHQARLDLAGAERRLVEAQKALDQASRALAETTLPKPPHPDLISSRPYYEALATQVRAVDAATARVSIATADRDRVASRLAIATSRSITAGQAYAEAKRWGDIARKEASSQPR